MIKSQSTPLFEPATSGDLQTARLGPSDDTLRRTGSSVFSKNYDPIDLSEWNKSVITSFPSSLQFYYTYHNRYGWVSKLKELAFLSDLFRAIDTDKSGAINKQEFGTDYFLKVKLSPIIKLDSIYNTRLENDAASC